MAFEEDFSYFGSEGEVIAAHRGTARHLASCKLAIVGENLTTWYSHIIITIEDWQEAEQGDGIGIVETHRSQANCECDPTYCKLELPIS